MAKPHERLNQALNERRLELDLRWTDIAERARIAVPTLWAIRTGKNAPGELTRQRLETALQWARGSIDTILAGGDATPIDADPDDRGQEIASLLAQARHLTEIAERLHEDYQRDRRHEADS